MRSCQILRETVSYPCNKCVDLQKTSIIHIKSITLSISYNVFQIQEPFYSRQTIMH
ncbi:hypothetical protein E2C01_003124 [Portunus trituberculatus]|uniref:Uncharacterized protein n=1 Tax=Portunus trituberculatus TaxID=210409 RepID=A0A5B7CLJ2_PORTR|nr:hypothetical protein [Portunus trituberculatus]